MREPEASRSIQTEPGHEKKERGREGKQKKREREERGQTSQERSLRPRGQEKAKSQKSMQWKGWLF